MAEHDGLSVTRDQPASSRFGGSSRASASSSRSSSVAGNSGSRKKFATFSDIRAEDDTAPRDQSDDPDNLFTGGEKSGLAVQNPGEGSGPQRSGRLINDIFRQARQRHPDNDDDDLYDERAKPIDRFSGTGHTLGSEDVPSRSIATSSSQSPSPSQQPRKETTRKLYFWRNGFSVDDDGPLYRYDDPANIAHLEAIRSGRAPLSLLNVQGGEDVRVDVIKKDEDYVAPKKKVGGFSGKGMRLGSPVPSLSRQSSPPAASTTPTANPVASSSSSSSGSVLGSSGDAAVQLRLANGQAVRLKFDSEGPVQQLYDYINQQHATSRGFVLQTTFPNKELTDSSQSLKAAGVVNSVVVQKWA